MKQIFLVYDLILVFLQDVAGYGKLPATEAGLIFFKKGFSQFDECCRPGLIPDAPRKSDTRQTLRSERD